MVSLAAAAAFSALSVAVAPPPAPGPWHQLGAATTSRVDKQLHFFRTASSPKALGVVAVSSSARPIRLHWWSYCEFQSDDDMTEAKDAIVSGVKRIVVYPPVLDGATQCFVSVVARVAHGRVSAAVFDY